VLISKPSCTMVRKSTRTRRPNPKFQDGIISNLADAFGSDSEPDPYYLPKLRDTEKGDDDFDVREAAVDAITQTNEGDGNLSLSEADAAGASDASDVASPVENSDVEDILSDSTDDPIRAARHAEKLARIRREYASFLHPDRFHSRGYPDTFKQNTGKEDHWKLTFGAAKEDTRGIIKSRDRWSDVGSVTFPSKAGLREVVQDAAEDCADKCIGWYDREDGLRFRKRQRVERLDPVEGKTYLPQPDPGKEDGHSLLMGPLNAQKMFHLPVGQSMNLADAWPRVPGLQPVREGWLWNVGRGAQTLAWAPLPPQSTKQYLALGVPSSKEQKADFMTKNTEWKRQRGASAFVPAAPTKACVQVWEFVSKKGLVMDDGTSGNRAYGEEDVLSVLDMIVKPRLRLVIATEWGDVRRLQWCPAYPAQAPDEGTDHGETSLRLGLLAGLWGDGKARVIEVRLGDSGDEPEYGNYEPSSPHLPIV
jgi:transcription factor C subunit 6